MPGGKVVAIEFLRDTGGLEKVTQEQRQTVVSTLFRAKEQSNVYSI